MGVGVGEGGALTVVCENLCADALVDHVALGEALSALGPAGALLRDQPGDGPLVQHVSGGALWGGGGGG